MGGVKGRGHRTYMLWLQYQAHAKWDTCLTIYGSQFRTTYSLIIINPHLIFSLTEVLHRLPKLNHSYFSCILPPANKFDINLWLLLVNELSSCRYSQKRIEKGETIFQFKKSATTLQLRKNVQKKHRKVQLED